MEHNRLEIVLLACGILILVALLSLVLYLGHRKRNQERRDSQESQRSYSSHDQGRECLFKEVFADHPDHDSPLLDGGGTSFIATVSRRSQSIVGAAKHELLDLDLGRSLLGHSQGEEALSLLDGDADHRLQEGSGEEQGAANHSDTARDSRHGSSTRRRSNALVKQPAGPGKRKSEQSSRERIREEPKAESVVAGRFFEHLTEEDRQW